MYRSSHVLCDFMVSGFDASGRLVCIASAVAAAMQVLITMMRRGSVQ
jgi:hypothetical protein